MDKQTGAENKFCQIIRTNKFKSLLEMFQTSHLYNLPEENISNTTDLHSNQKCALHPAKVFEMVYSIVMELVGDPVQYAEFVQLWNFILLSHPPQDNYLEYSIADYTTWIDLGKKKYHLI